jgi:hypothetical protein
MRTVVATRYVTPLREGGSLPAIVEGDDDGLYVVKFRGAGQGPKALVAEILSGELARALGLPVPELVYLDLDPAIANAEPDPEIQDLLRKSEGLNLAIDYLPGSISFDPLIDRPLADLPRLASAIVWFDAFVSNVDRTPRNTNLLMWHRAPWLIDHGSTLYFHHTPGWEADRGRAKAPFKPIRDHVLLESAARLEQEDEPMAAALGPDVIEEILALVPAGWLENRAAGDAPATLRAAYRRYLLDRLAAPRGFLEEAVRAR